jgi:anaerobic selenocysteine-containing dehydrogenase
MTNHWVDIGNTSLVFVIGANPAENHPASMAHVNRARYDTWATPRNRKARMVVVDPRKTRTAVQADLYVRIRPGTDIAFINGLLNYIIAGADAGTVDATFATNFRAWHNNTSPFSSSGLPGQPDAVCREFYADDSGSAAVAFNAAALSTAGVYAKVQYDGAPTNAFDSTDYGKRGWPKWCDTRAKVVVASGVADYKRVVMKTTTDKTFTNMIELAESIDDADCVYQKLKSHVAYYTDTVVADICGCAPSDVAAVAEELIANSQMKSDDFGADGYHEPNSSGYRATTLMYAMGATQHTYGSQNVRSYAILQTMLGNMGRPGGGINALRGIHNVQGSTDMGVLFDGIPGYYTGNPGHLTGGLAESYAAFQNRQFGFRVAAATGGAGLPKSAYAASGLGLQQQGFYNMTSAFFGDWSAQWANNSDFDKLYDLWPKGNGKDHISAFRAMKSLTVSDEHVTFTGTTPQPLAKRNPDILSVTSVKSQDGLTTYATPGDYTVDLANGTVTRVDGGTIADLAVLHVTYKVREIKACVVWGQNPAVTEPNQSSIRAGFEDLDLLVVVDNFETETAAVSRKADGVTYLLPASSYVEEAGSVSNSGRWIQWRMRARKPHGNSKADIDLLLRFAKEIDRAGGYNHIVNQWTDATYGMTVKPVNYASGAYTVLFADQYGGYDPGLLNTAGDIEAINKVSKDGVDAVGDADTFGKVVAGGSVYGTEAVCEKIFEQIANTLGDNTGGGNSGKGTLWIYARAYNETVNASERPTLVNGSSVNWTKVNRAKERNITNVGTWFNYPRFGFAWLLNRRVMYNNVIAGKTQVPDEADNFVGPGYLARMMTFTAAQTNTLADWTGKFSYRSYNTVKDMPSKTGVGTPHAAGLPGNIPAHCEPIETPRRDLAATWGRNTAWSSGTTFVPLVKDDTKVAMWGAGESFSDSMYADSATRAWEYDAKEYPLVLTTIRCVEHFQGGPITRNNSWNLEAEPVPWIEINSVDARACVPQIKDGDWVNVTTARSNSTGDQEDRTALLGTALHKTDWAHGFRARVGVGLQGNQRVGAGVVAIPWHWGDAGLGTGSRANDLCIDSYDANTIIPEYKACLCKITKIV